MTFSKTFIALSFIGLGIAACSSNNGGGNAGGTNTVVICPGIPGTPCNPAAGGTATVPVCDSNALTPFIPFGPASRVSQIPAGSYRYIGGDVYAETSNQTPQTQIAIADDQPTNPAYPGTLKCLSNLGGTIPAFDTAGSINRNVQVTPTEFNLTGLRRLSASYQNGTLQTLLFDQSNFTMKTPMQIDQDQTNREAQGWSVNVYRLSATEFKIVIIRSFSYQGINGNLFVAARYAYTP